MWDKMTVGKFQQLHDIIAGQSFENEIEKKTHVLACLDDVDVEKYLNMPVEKLLQEIKRTSFLSVGDIPKVAAPKYATVNGVKYRFIYDFRDLTAGQFIDAVNNTKDSSRHIINIHRTLACLAIPEGKRYLEVPFDKVADDMLSVGILEAQACALFFWDVWNSFLKSMPSFSEKALRKATKAKKERLQAALELFGVGSNLQQK